jgi:hypothetical protein
MVTINLLPWRQLARVKKRRQKIIMGLLVMVLLAICWIYFPEKKPIAALPPPLISTIEPCEQIVGQMKLIGYLRGSSGWWGILLMPNGKTQEVEVNTIIDCGARVTNIDARRVTFSLHHKTIYSISR